MASIHQQPDGSYLLTRDDGETQSLAPGTDIDAAAVAFFGPDLSMPDGVPMDRLRNFLIATNRMGQVNAFLASLPSPQKDMAQSEFLTAPAFIPTGPLGRACQAAVGLSDVSYAEAMRDAAAFSIDDYGAPKPTLLAAVAKFFLGT